MRVLIVDDEPLPRAALVRILRGRSDIDVLDVADNGVEALEKLESSSYDAVLLDVKMPEISGVAVAARLKERGGVLPSIVFVTAYDEHAIEAFEQRAVDYVLKPFTRERIEEALALAFRRTAGERAAQWVAGMEQRQVRAEPRAARIAIKSKGRIVFVEPSAVIAVVAQGNYVLLQRESGSYLLHESISVVTEQLKEYGFIRIHRSVLVNSSFVEAIEPQTTGDYRLRVRGGQEFRVARTYKKNLKSLAALWIGVDTFAPDAR